MTYADRIFPYISSSYYNIIKKYIRVGNNMAVLVAICVKENQQILFLHKLAIRA